jgi:protocatechuate 3,4-dioxygenase beta subunit
MWLAWQRRTLLRGSLALALGGLMPAAVRAALQPTPPQTAGPFYPVELPLDSDNDLLKVAGQTELAEGTPLHLFGQVVDGEGRPVPGTLIELWQCDAQGLYRHPADGGDRHDPAFQGYGRTTSNADGGYRFRTIRPVAYPGRAPHIHFKLEAPDGRRLTTQMYIAGELQNDRDGLYRSLGEAAAQVTVMLTPAQDLEPGAVAGLFPIVLG